MTEKYVKFADMIDALGRKNHIDLEFIEIGTLGANVFSKMLVELDVIDFECDELEWKDTTAILTNLVKIEDFLRQMPITIGDVALKAMLTVEKEFVEAVSGRIDSLRRFTRKSEEIKVNVLKTMSHIYSNCTTDDIV